jgi:hypothetical protein
MTRYRPAEKPAAVDRRSGFWHKRISRVMPGLDPGIQLDRRVKPGGDTMWNV